MKIIKFLLWTVVILFIVSFAVVNVLKIIRPGEVAAIEEYGHVRNQSYQNGIVTIVPGGKVVRFPRWEQKYDFSWQLKTGNVQTVTIKGALNYSLNPQQVHVLYQAVGENYKPVLVEPLLQGTLNQMIGKQEPAYIVNNPEVIGEAALYIVKDQLKQTNLVFVRDLQLFAPTFDKDLEQAYKDVAVAQLATKRVEEETKQLLMKAEAEGKALKLKSEALRNPLIVQYEVAKALGAWKGNLPNTLVLGQGALPVLTGK